VQNRDCAADVVNIKISKFGGLTKAKQAIDLCSDLGIAMTIEGRTQRASILLQDCSYFSRDEILELHF
jgi:L-alanine-DL-glutamate epimerase-like enolase superfamily enzyme